MRDAHRSIAENPFLWEHLRYKHVYAPVGVVMLLMIGQQLAGVNMLFSNLNIIFKVSKHDSLQPKHYL